MTALQFHFASGDALYSGVLLSSAALAVAVFRENRGIRFWAAPMALCGPIFAILASNPTPLFISIPWVAAILATWILAQFKGPGIRRACGQFALAGLFLGLVALGVELPHRFWHGVATAPTKRIYVIGDSLSAFVGDGGDRTWPRLMAQDHSLELVDLAVAGATTVSQLVNTQNTRFSDGLVIIEIGGNDMFTQRPSADFERDLEQLISRTVSNRTRPVMFELPLLPFYQGYAEAQRHLAAKYGIAMIPRRTLASLLISPGMTIADGIHLTQAGQRRMAELIWQLLGKSLDDVR